MILFPSNYKQFPNASEGENEIYSLLRNSKLASNWIVLHSLEIAHHLKKNQSEADFVFMIPNVGILVLEVKSCKSLSFDGTTWQLGNKQETRGPFKQASDNMFSIREYLESVNIDIKAIPFVSAVWFTHISRKKIQDSISWMPEQFLSAEDLKQEITQVIAGTTKTLISNLKRNFGAQVAPFHQLELVSQALRPRFVAHQAPKERARDVKRFLDQALEIQLETVKLLTKFRAIALQGLAGTGKTFIALHIAREAHERGERVLFLCYNAMLSEFIKSQMLNYPLVKVSSLHALLLEVSGLNVPLNAGEEWWAVTLPEEALKNADEYSKKYEFDTLIIDEAQDLGTTNLLLVLDQLLKGGLSKSLKIFVCGDFTHQGVYLPGVDTLQNYMSSIPDLQVLPPLLDNCRNIKELGDFLNTFLEMRPKYEKFRRNDRDGEVHPIRIETEDEILGEVKKLLNAILLKFTPDQVILLSAQKAKLAELVAKLEIQTTEIRKPKTNHVRWGSPQEFKGLEALAVLLIEFFDQNKILDETFYIGATRSIHDFYCVISRDKIKQLVDRNNVVNG